MNKLNPIPMSGIEGHNLLGFLAALGVMYELDQATCGEVSLSWTRQRATWSPVIWSECGTTDELVQVLVKKLCGMPRPVPPVVEQFSDLKFTPAEFRELLERGNKDLALLAALATETATEDGQAQDSGFRTMAGAGHQHFLGFARYLIENVVPEDLAGTLFEPWKYLDEGYSLRWDSADYRPHALRGLDPSKDKLQSVWWANRLGFSALPLFPCYPSSRGLRTAGFDVSRNEMLVWPIWHDPITVDVLRSLIPFTRLLFDGETGITERGIQAIYQSQRFTEGKYRNFTPGRMVG